MPDHVFANCGFRELDSQLQEFVMDCRCSPADIVEAQSPYEFAGFFGNAWPPGLSMPNFPGPVPTEPATVPQSITAAAFTIQRAPRHRDQNWDNATQKRRSAGFS